MRSRSVLETAIVCGSGVFAVGFGARAIGQMDGVSAAWIVGLCMIGLVAVAFAWSRATTRRARLELEGGERTRELAAEYQRLADMAITAQEHTDLKLSEVNARLVHMSEQIDALQKILNEVE